MEWLYIGAAYFAVVAFVPLAAIAVRERRESRRTREFVAFMQNAWSD